MKISLYEFIEKLFNSEFKLTVVFKGENEENTYYAFVHNRKNILIPVTKLPKLFVEAFEYFLEFRGLEEPPNPILDLADYFQFVVEEFKIKNVPIYAEMQLIYPDKT